MYVCVCVHARAGHTCVCVYMYVRAQLHIFVMCVMYACAFGVCLYNVLVYMCGCMSVVFGTH